MASICKRADLYQYLESYTPTTFSEMSKDKYLKIYQKEATTVVHCKDRLKETQSVSQLFHRGGTPQGV